MPRSLKAWAGELVGTFLFFTIGAGAVIIATSSPNSYGVLGIALAHGFALAAAITVFGRISGGHFNPAITFSAWIGRKIAIADALGYVACQLLGALGAGVFLRVAFTESAWRISNLGSPSLGAGVSAGRAVLIEAVGTFILALVIWGTGIDERGPRLGGLSIGLVLTGLILAFGPLTGAAFNPARFLGTAAVAGHLNDWWVYIVGPCIGGAAAAVIYQTLFWDGLRRTTAGEEVAAAAEDPVPQPSRKPATRKR